MELTGHPAVTVALCLAAYLFGSVLFALPVCRAWKLPDPRAQGSGNPGATNVYRTGGWAPAALTLALDAFKGWLPVWLAHQLSMPVMAQAMVALCAVTGHMIPVFHRFQGGKGVATALGAGLALAPLTTLIIAGIWLLVMWRWRISALASLVAVVCGPVVSAFLDPETLPLFGLLALLIVVRHRANLIRLAQGRETGF
ncbi:glycerol-3-phosphate 1-O-acyltransferase PlsY [Marinobacter lutaoensis]|jgi:glycerol-3-phosphate acyltransferase PlsY|uniref:Glycerol-3-phosphate acyltransferase n=1 Tax=Marinobacter lutaoensis TaxID=135739 RepID=A0A1V2DP22_9GAMM|nr:glycerol-3-phosphate 1-O-acyltransferase PlsY [Marinobacter lutaoensis]MBE02490.1 acyl-phosphate glycerol 3-phosphate acyltransferase [Marinobacter sp.]MBI43511.1 acyl-phosphate glycerol 3-phosphate acyltransferase [Oceanospirillales bacterium]NVD36054.1 glycerol-3-phosphate 1-O-acyltransferase PlsY [Marinobacter lutaoensis]ONF42355.1 acyl-phosphate glycerol 3-phosphate acyltransferase [Marinobacter lutaoensis]|tara:strand:+ start:2533 stop:3126 length:594 start_codon:yes stop_codon:yes gene_type:complete